MATKNPALDRNDMGSGGGARDLSFILNPSPPMAVPPIGPSGDGDPCAAYGRKGGGINVPMPDNKGPKTNGNGSMGLGVM